MTVRDAIKRRLPLGFVLFSILLLNSIFLVGFGFHSVWSTIVTILLFSFWPILFPLIVFDDIRSNK